MKRFFIKLSIWSIPVLCTVLLLSKGCTTVNDAYIAEMRESHKKLSAKVDSIKQVLNNVENIVIDIDERTLQHTETLDSIEFKVDRLQKGQKIIYDAVNKRGSSSFWDLLSYE